MIVVVDEREIVTDGYESGFAREGVSAAGFTPVEFQGWMESAPSTDLDAVEAFLLGNCQKRKSLSGLIRQKSGAPLIATSENEGLDNTLDLFASGVDDVVRKPVHIREILARVAAIVRRIGNDTRSEHVIIGDMKIFLDGREVEVAGRVLPLPRRERRILEYLARNCGRRVTKSQIFNAVYGLFDDNVEECVIESHISKLRKKLRARLGYDPIDSKRFLGYCLNEKQAADTLQTN